MGKRTLWTILPYIFLLLISAFLSGPVMGYLSENILGGLLAQQNILYWLALLLATGVSLAFLSFFCKNYSLAIEKRSVIHLQDLVINKVQNSAYSLQQPMAEISNVLHENVPALVAKWIGILTGASSLLFTFVLSSLYLASSSPYLLLVILILIGLIILLLTKGSARIGKLQQKIVSLSNEVAGTQWDFINNREIAPFLNYERLFSGYRGKTAERKISSIKMMKLLFASVLVKMHGSIAVVIITALFGGVLCVLGKLEPSRLFGTLTILPLYTSALLQIPNLINSLHVLRGDMQALNPLVSTPQYKSGGKLTVEKEFNISCVSTSFQYQEKLVLSNISYTFERGRMYALYGESGCGKTTLIKLLLRLVQPTSGDIQYNGISQSQIERGALWKAFYYLAPEPFLYRGTLRENILCEPGLPPEMEEQYLKTLALLSLGHLNTSAVLEPVALSAGEKQKISIARMMCSYATVWICDEPTSAIDDDSEKSIAAALRDFAEKRNLLIICISHRRQTIEAAHVKLLLEDGAIHEVIANE